jgi:hypothetical protein
MPRTPGLISKVLYKHTRQTSQMVERVQFQVLLVKTLKLINKAVGVIPNHKSPI